MTQQLTIFPGHPLKGEVDLPGDKSLSHRAALLAALAEGESCTDHFLVAGVTRVMLDALTALGVAWSLEGSYLRVEGRGLAGLGAGGAAPGPALFCGSSATTLRLLAGALAAAGSPARLEGSPGLERRPMARLVEPLREMGVQIDAAPGGTAPLQLHPRPNGQKLRAAELHLPVASAQLKSALLLAGLSADGPLTLHEPGPSRDHTERMLSAAGVAVTSAAENDGCRVNLVPPSDGKLKPLQLSLPGDFSSAAFLIVAGLITPGSELRIRRVGLNPTRTGLLDVLSEMGGEIRVVDAAEEGNEPVGDLLVRSSQLTGGEVCGTRVVRMIDEFPAFGAAAAFAEGPTRVTGAEELRYKESDRISQICQGLRAIGVPAEETPDGFSIPGSAAPAGGKVDAAGDHRLAMAFTLAGLASLKPVTVSGAEMISESYPGFIETLQSLGAEILVDEEPG